MRFAAVPGYSPGFPVTYQNMYQDYSLQTAGFSDPFNPVNRRISIIVMNKKAEEAAQHDGGTVELDAENGDAKTTLTPNGAAPAAH